MVALLVIAAALLGLLLLALAAPVVVDFQLEGGAPVRGQVGIRWLGGLVGFRMQVPAVRRPREARGHVGERGTSQRGARRKARPRGRGRGRTALAVLRQGPFRDRAVRLAGDLLRAIDLEDFRLRARIGLGDPADTGRLWAFMGPVSAILSGIERAEVEIQPEFLEAVLEFHASGRATVVPLRVLALAAAFALAPPSIRAWRSLAAGHA